MGASLRETGSRASTEPSCTVSALTGFDPARREKTRQWIMREFRSLADRRWQLAKVEMMLRSPHCLEEWRDNLIDQQAVLTDAIASKQSTRDGSEPNKTLPTNNG